MIIGVYLFQVPYPQNSHACLCTAGALYGRLSCWRLVLTDNVHCFVRMCVNTPTYSICTYVFIIASHYHLFCIFSSGEEEVAHGLKVWRKALSEVRSAAQLAMCIQQLQKSIAWERSIMKVVSNR